MLKLILASSSSTRAALLTRLQINFTAIAPDVDETAFAHEKPAELALRLAQTKAQVIAERFPDALIIGSDQVIMYENARLDKPGSIDNAIAQLQFVSGKEIHSYTGLCLLNSKTQRIQLAVENYQVAFRQLTRAMIEDYVARDQPLHCAGSIKAEGIGITLFTHMRGRDPTALLGLPLIALTDMLLNENIAILG